MHHSTCFETLCLKIPEYKGGINKSFILHYEKSTEPIDKQLNFPKLSFYSTKITNSLQLLQKPCRQANNPLNHW